MSKPFEIVPGESRRGSFDVPVVEVILDTPARCLSCGARDPNRPMAWTRNPADPQYCMDTFHGPWTPTDIEWNAAEARQDAIWNAAWDRQRADVARYATRVDPRSDSELRDEFTHAPEDLA